ncbi:protein bicaudal C 1-B-like protein [Aphelenchoides avenae]|nr:protein bicaudal C 1-B-like protein [Aphelenchus avenae]
MAKNLIADLLRVKKDRVTLKMEINHSAHSHIIGRGGKNTQDIMRETMCHIHFPDSNKHSEVEKNNQVSIAGSTGQVDIARQRLRLSAPITVTLIVPVTNAASVPSTAAELQRRVGMPDLSFTLSTATARAFQCSIKGSAHQDQLIITTVDRICNLLTVSSTAAVRLAFEIRPALLHKSYGLFSVENIQRIATSTQTQIQFLDQGPCLVISGAVAYVLAARKEMTGLLPVTVQFEKSPHVQPSKSLLRALEADLNVQISEKKKPTAGGVENPK